ncbi:MAG: DUF21 domain-containing protein [Phycisphaerae bacterium]|nr:DUF21 domain-containing protein [Phycisphaerae bacterium]
MAILWLVLLVMLLLASGFFSGSEMGLYCVNRLRVRLQAERGQDARSRLLWRLVQQPQRTVMTVLLGNNLVGYLLTVAGIAFLDKAFGLSGAKADFYVALALTPLVFVFGDVVPKNWFRIEADRLMILAAPALRACELLSRLTGVLPFVLGISRLSARLAGYDEEQAWRNPRGEVIGLLREGGAEGTLTEDQARIIERVMNLSSVRVGAMMVPIQKLTTVPIDATRDTFEQLVARCKHSRLPVVGHDRQTIAGIVTVHSVLADRAEGSIQRHMHPPATIAASESATKALVFLQQNRQRMAVVTDPRRGWVGIITLRDVVEEIFGELAEW